MGLLSCFEYSRKKEFCKESDKCVATDYFTKSKLSLLNWLKKNHKKYDVSYLWLRIFYAYGLYQRKESLIPYLINNLKKNKKINIKNPHTTLDFINVEDVSKYFLKAIKIKCNSGIYNVGSGKGIKLIKILKIIEQKLNIKTSFINDKYENENNMMIFTANTSKSKKVFKIGKQINIEEGITKIIYAN